MVEVGIEKEKLLAIIVLISVALVFLFVIDALTGHSIICTISRAILGIIPWARESSQVLLGGSDLCDITKP